MGTDKKANILLGDFVGAGHKSNKWHQVCGARFLYVDKMLVCPSCGYRMAEDENKPKTKLRSVDEGLDVLVQPEKKKKGEDDLPPGAQIVAEFDLSTAS